ncbi:MAG: MFS transporter [Chloroflexi bacterium]|nr:MAG: MFS transporter [Chloroflexota bacterium]
MLVVIMMGFGIVIPIMPFYIELFDAQGTELGLLMATYAVMQFLFAPVWGNLSDRYGRKPILLIGVFGNGVAMILFGLSTQLWMLFASRALAGFLSSATLPTAMAYVSDSTSEEDRGGGMGMIGAAMGLGMVIGPGLGGTLAEYSLSVPFFLAGGLSFIALALIWVMMPESLPAEKRTSTSERIQGLQLKEMWQALWGPIGILLLLAFLVSFGFTKFESIFGLFAANRYDYGPSEVGLILTVIGLVSAVVQGGLTGPVTKRWGETAVIKTSLFGTAIGFLLMLLATNLTTVLITTSLFVVSSAMLRPSVSALTSLRADSGQGIALGLNNSFMSLGRIAGPILAGLLFDINLIFPYITGAIVMLVGFGVCLRWLPKAQQDKPKIALQSEVASKGV